MPDHVADDERHAAAGQRDRVEPVPAGGRLVPGHQVARRDPELGQHRQRGRQQRFLQLGDHPGIDPALRRALRRPVLRRPLLRRPTLGHPVRDVRGDEQQAVDRVVSGPPRRHREVGVDLPDPAGTEVELRPPLGSRLRLACRVHPVEQLVELLPLDLGERLPARHADHAGSAGERPVRRVRRHDAMIRAR